MKKTPAFLSAALGLGLGACSSHKPISIPNSSLPQHAGSFDLKESFEPNPGLHILEYTHTKSGMRVFIVPKPGIGVVSVVTAYKVGSRFESPGRRGLAHLFEHMMFRGTENYPNPFKTLSAWGNRFNAYTSSDLTLYYEVVPKSLLGEALNFEAERMRKLSITKEGFNAERGAVVSERKMRTEDSPMGKLRWESYALAFDKHPYGTLPIGLQKDLDATTFEEALQFYQKFYAPNRAVLAIVGDFKVPDLLAELEKNYGSFAAEAWTEPKLALEPLRKGLRRKVLPARVESVYFTENFLGTKYGDKDGITDILMCALFADGKMGYLAFELVEKNIAQGVNADCGPSMDRGLNEIFVTANPGVSVEKLEMAYNQAKKGFGKWLTKDRVEKAKLFYLAAQLDTLRDPANLAEELGRNAVTTGDPLYNFEALRKIQKVSFEDIQKRYAQWEVNPTRVFLKPVKK